ncbi:hypothetical protein ABT112_33455 [Streptomyces sp. NPDC002055]|uniref:COG1470 family protein n=1 Tax=Streptomyces sp. NPDC002055 TaxID=3154534 RepID=UPI003325B8CD
MPPRPRSAVLCAATLSAAALTVLCGPLGPRPAAAAGPGAPERPAGGPDWSVAPASGGAGGPRTDRRRYVYLEGRPGAVLQDRLSVTNRADRARTVRLRGRTGPETGPGVRVSFAAAAVRIPARTRADIPFTVGVAPDAVPGERSGAITVTGGSRAADVRIHLRVTGPTLPALAVEDVAVVRTGSGAEIRYALVNRGNTVLRPRLAVRAEGLFGEVLRRDARPLRLTLEPGRRVRLTERWAGAPRLDAVDVRLVATAAGGAHATATAPYSGVPRYAAALLLGPVAAAGAWWVRASGRRRGVVRSCREEACSAESGEGSRPEGSRPEGDHPEESRPGRSGPEASGRGGGPWDRDTDGPTRERTGSER